MQPWLSPLVARLADSPSMTDRAAALGLLARMDEGNGTRLLLRDQVRSLPADILEEVERVAVNRAWNLIESIEDLNRPGLYDILPLMTANVVEDRDELQSVKRFLRLAGKGEHLVEALANADHVAAIYMSSMADHLPALADDPQADRWVAVGWMEPDAWWAALD